MEDPAETFLKQSSVEMKSFSTEDMDQAEMAVYGNVSKEFKDYKVKVSKHAKEKSKLQKQFSDLQNQVKNQENGKVDFSNSPQQVKPNLDKEVDI